MLVEFVGAAGVGKSFLAEKLINAEQSEIRNLRDIAIFKFHPRNLMMALDATILGARTMPKSISKFKHAAAVLTRYHIRREITFESDGRYVTSEGIFHQLITLYRNSRCLSMIQLADVLFERIRPPDLVIVVVANADTVLSRRTARNRPKDVFSAESVKVDLAIAQEAIEVMNHVRKTCYPSLKILQVATDDEGAQSALRRILDVLEDTSRSSDN